MTTPQILYGVQNGDLVHIDQVERGLACLCICVECGRTLVAKKGSIVSYHFAHDAEEVDCNPTPESLIHSYAKQQVSKLHELLLPGFEVRAEVQSNDGQLHEVYWRHQPYYRLQVKSAEVEADLGSVQPDVLFTTQTGRVAIEVYFRHQVPSDKIAKLQVEHHLSTLEIDLSDLLVDASSKTINAAIGDIGRWTWLHNQHQTFLQPPMCGPLARSTRIFVPLTSRPVPTVSSNSLPSRKLAKADTLMSSAKRLAADLLQRPPAIRLQRVRALEFELHIALHCFQIGVLPTRLPKHLMQTVEGQGSLGMHPVLWETGVFAKFCMVGSEFSVKVVEAWVRKSFDDKALLTPDSITQTTNGFSPSAEALYHFLRNLSAQGLLKEIEGSKPWESRFAPVRPSKAEVLDQLLSHRSAIQVWGEEKAASKL